MRKKSVALPSWWPTYLCHRDYSLENTSSPLVFNSYQQNTKLWSESRNGRDCRWGTIKMGLSEHVDRIGFSQGNMHICFSYCVWWMDTYTCNAVIVHLTSTVMTPAWQRTTGSAADGGWENYNVVVQHMCITTLYFDNFLEIHIEIIYSLKFLLVQSEFWLLGHQITRNFL
jgi:hypothetical protein